MATIKCPKCGYKESDGRPHDTGTYYEICSTCSKQGIHRPGKNA